tara:strand:+ start:2098 stop:2913 length:816 start_codon:yes stop_codon:yes gene_type:complete
MKSSKDGKLILIENPLTGNTMFSTGFKLEPVDTVARWEIPSVAKKKIGLDAWNKAEKVVFVRDSVRRFQDAATLVVTNKDSLEEGSFKDALDKALDKKSTPIGKAEAILKILADTPNEERPILLREQSQWLEGTFDLIIATNNLADYVNINKHLGVSLFRERDIMKRDGFEKVIAPTDNVLELITKAYPEDSKRLGRVMVWSPIKGTVNLITGSCVECKPNDKGVYSLNGEELIDLIGKNEEAPTPKKIKRASKKVTRKRASRRRSGEDNR